MFRLRRSRVNRIVLNVSHACVDPRRIAVAFCAIGAFLHLYAPQAVLPMMAQEYGVGAADASLIITASTLAVAATAPFTGALSDVLGRKRVIVAAHGAAADPRDHDGAGADASTS